MNLIDETLEIEEQTMNQIMNDSRKDERYYTL